MKRKFLIIIIILFIITGFVFLNKILSKEKTYNGTFILYTSEPVQISLEETPHVRVKIF